MVNGLLRMASSGAIKLSLLTGTQHDHRYETHQCEERKANIA